MIVSRDSDFESVEKSGAYKGLYFILGGSVPVLDKNKAMEQEALDNQNYVNTHAGYDPISIYKKAFSIMPRDVKTEVKKYAEELEKGNNDTIKNDPAPGVDKNFEVKIAALLFKNSVQALKKELHYLGNSKWELLVTCGARHLKLGPLTSTQVSLLNRACSVAARDSRQQIKIAVGGKEVPLEISAYMNNKPGMRIA
jgi:hypothetical protein